jgi:hypothetical protein
MPLIPFGIYLLLCLLVGFKGMGSRLGYWGTVFLGAIITPVVMYLILLLAGTLPSLAGGQRSDRYREQ